MTYFKLSKVELYAPGNTEFIQKAVALFLDEINVFLEGISAYQSNGDFTEFRSRIHKIKASSILFMLPDHILESLIFMYNSDKDKIQTSDLKTHLDEISTFYKQLILELEKLQKKLV